MAHDSFLTTLRAFGTLFRQSCVQILNDPLALIVTFLALIVPSMIVRIPMMTFGEHIRIMREQCLAFLLLLILIFVVLALIRHLKNESEQGQTILLFARPVLPALWFLARMSSIMVFSFWILIAGVIGTLWALRIGYVIYEVEFLGSLILYAVTFGMMLLFFLLNYFMNLNCLRNTVVFLPPLLAIIFAVMLQFPYENQSYQESLLFDTRTLVATGGIALLIPCYVSILSALALFVRSMVLFPMFLGVFVISVLLSFVSYKLPPVCTPFLYALFPNMGDFWWLSLISESENTTGAVIVLYDLSISIPVSFYLAGYVFALSFFWMILGAWRANRAENY